MTDEEGTTCQGFEKGVLRWAGALLVRKSPKPNEPNVSQEKEEAEDTGESTGEVGSLFEWLSQQRAPA